jgi:hypothetical protein
MMFLFWFGVFMWCVLTDCVLIVGVCWRIVSLLLVCVGGSFLYCWCVLTDCVLLLVRVDRLCPYCWCVLTDCVLIVGVCWRIVSLLLRLSQRCHKLISSRFGCSLVTSVDRASRRRRSESSEMTANMRICSLMWDTAQGFDQVSALPKCGAPWFILVRYAWGWPVMWQVSGRRETHSGVWLECQKQRPLGMVGGWYSNTLNK